MELQAILILKFVEYLAAKPVETTKMKNYIKPTKTSTCCKLSAKSTEQSNQYKTLNKL